MKKMMTLVMMMTIAISAAAMTYSEARNEALFLSDKMAYELNLSNAQYDAVYEINFDYFYSVNTSRDLFGTYWTRRNLDLQYVLSVYQYNLFMASEYFYRPMTWSYGAWHFNIYSRYTDRSRMYRTHPTVYVSYRGGRNRLTTSYYAGRNWHKPNAPVGNHKGHVGHGNTLTGTQNHGTVTHNSSTTRPGNGYVPRTHNNTSNTHNGNVTNRSFSSTGNSGGTPRKGSFGGTRTK